MSRNNLDSSPGVAVEGETIPLEYLRNINPVTVKMENGKKICGFWKYNVNVRTSFYNFNVLIKEKNI